MIKRIACVLLCIIFVLLLTGCGTKLDSIDKKPERPSQFVKVEENSEGFYLVVYHRETKVMYVVSRGPYNCGNFTLLVNPDGTPMVWNGN